MDITIPQILINLFWLIFIEGLLFVFTTILIEQSFIWSALLVIGIYTVVLLMGFGMWLWLFGYIL